MFLYQAQGSEFNILFLICILQSSFLTLIYSVPPVLSRNSDSYPILKSGTLIDLLQSQGKKPMNNLFTVLYSGQDPSQYQSVEVDCIEKYQKLMKTIKELKYEIKELRRSVLKFKQTSNPNGDSDLNKDSTQSSVSDEASNPHDESDNDGFPKVPTRPGNPTKRPKIIFEESFSAGNWKSKWSYTNTSGLSKPLEPFSRIRSNKSGSSSGGQDYSLMTSNQGYEDYFIAAPFPNQINSNDGPLLIQFSLQFQAKPHCQHASLRIYDCRFNSETVTPNSPFMIQFGPNICASDGPSGNKREVLQLLMLDRHKGEMKTLSQNLKAVTSTKLHTYSLILQPNGAYQIMISDAFVQNGTLEEAIPLFKGYDSLCAVGIVAWHSVMDKFFKGQTIIDDILLTSDLALGELRRREILNMN